MKGLLAELLKESACEYQILGEIGVGNSDTDIIFKDHESLRKFKNVLIKKLSLNYTWKIELFVTRAYKQECKFHIFCDEELFGQLDLWLVVQRKGLVLYEYDYNNTVKYGDLNFVKESAHAEYKEKKLRFNTSFSVKYFALVLKNYLFGFDWYYFYGVDGVGKSSQIELFLNCFFNEVFVVHTMPKFLRRRKPVSEKGVVVRENQPMNLFKSIIYSFYWILEVLIFRIRKGKRAVVIFDRGPLEVAVQEVYQRVPLSLRRALLLSHKTYRNAVVLTGDAPVIWRRKKELSLERTKMQIAKYEQLKHEHGVDVILNTEGLETVSIEVKVNLLNE